MLSANNASLADSMSLRDFSWLLDQESLPPASSQARKMQFLIDWFPHHHKAIPLEDAQRKQMVVWLRGRMGE